MGRRLGWGRNLGGCNPENPEGHIGDNPISPRGCSEIATPLITGRHTGEEMLTYALPPVRSRGGCVTRNSPSLPGLLVQALQLATEVSSQGLSLIGQNRICRVGVG